ncbi:MAG: glycosyltransferase family 2 protein [Bacteroidia bacterium]|nr:glycosyltransferase family 2 protein [Bacteroidia bacterium]
MVDLSVSIITVSHNSIGTISDTIKSVLGQTYPNIEYIIIDGSSTDGTIELINSFSKRISKFVSEPDVGIYDAINKGIRLATGNIVGILNSDDFFYDNNVIEKVVKSFNENKIDGLYGDVQFVDPIKTSKIIRYYSSKHFKTWKFKFGFMPAHPTVYLKREIFEKLGYYKTDYKIAADFELLIRFMYINKIKCKYLEMPFVAMRSGGVSNKSFKSNFILNKEIARACKENGIKTNYFFIYSKYLSKVFEFFGKKITNKNIID